MSSLARRRCYFVVGSALAALIAIAVLRCAHGGATPAGSSEPPAIHPPPSAAGKLPPTAATAPPAELPRPEPVAPALVAPDAGLNPVAHMMRNSEAPDRDLLAEIEHQTRQSPPPSIQQLITLHQNGAGRAELQRFIDQDLDRNPAIQAPARRWLRQVAPDPDAPRLPQSPEPGRRTGPRTIKPLTHAP